MTVHFRYIYIAGQFKFHKYRAESKHTCFYAGQGGASNLPSGGCGFNPSLVQQHSFVEIDNEIFSLLIQERQLSVSGKRMCISTGQVLRGLSLPMKSVVKCIDWLNMTFIVLTVLLKSNPTKYIRQL